MSRQGGTDAFAKREKAAEEVWFRQEERLSMLKRLESLVEKGKLDKSVLEEVKKATSLVVHHTGSVEVSPGVFKDVPGELKQRTEYVYAHVPGQQPPPPLSESDRMKLGMHVDMGPGKWSPGDASIFALSQTVAEEAAAKNLPPHEAARLARLQKAAGAVEVPTVFGFKLSPGMNPGRTFFWSSMLAIWGTAALVAASVRSFGPGPQTGPAAPREPSGHSAIGESLANFFLPWRERMAHGTAERAAAEHGEFVRRLKQGMVEEARAAAAKS